MSASALICLAPGSEETEAVTTIDLLVRGGVKVTTASVASDGGLAIVCSRGVKLLADAPLVEVADGDFDIIVLPAASRAQSASATARCWWKPSDSSTSQAALWPPSAPPRRPCWCPISCSQSVT